MGLLSDVGSGPVALDTSIFIYFIEEHPIYLPLVEALFEAIDAGELEAVTSSVTLLEVLVIPFRFANAALIDRYEALLTKSRGLRLVDLDRDFLRAVAQVRAATRAKAPDAMQLAAAMAAGCPVFLTNDDRIPDVPGLRKLLLEDYLPHA
ncbi:MAG: type II toxin-antitoxin system VapC family toxin [Thermoanaerobaculia bacterium]